MTNREGTITLDIRQYMDYGLDVYDVDSKKVGTVDDYDRATGYMMVRSSSFSDSDLYIPFSLITHIDPREVFVSKSRDELHREYRDRPPRSTVVEENIDLDTGEDHSRAITSEPSGYDGTPVVVDRADIGQMAHHIAPGFEVYTFELEDIGTVKQFDRETGQMLVEKGLFNKHTIVVPVALVDLVDQNERNVYLAVTSADLRRQSQAGIRNQKPDDVVVVETETREMS
jgi:hypothetical protein